MYDPSLDFNKETNKESEEKTVTSLSDYLLALDDIMEANGHQRLGYRGHKKRSYKLISGAGRTSRPLNINEEKAIFYEFQRNYKRFYPKDIKNDVDLLMLAQHYGLKTRLLDWSYNPLIALYMATKNEREDDSKKTDEPNKNENYNNDGPMKMTGWYL